jgi:hypothetical protein
LCLPYRLYMSHTLMLLYLFFMNLLATGVKANAWSGCGRALFLNAKNDLAKGLLLQTPRAEIAMRG